MKNKLPLVISSLVLSFSLLAGCGDKTTSSSSFEETEDIESFDYSDEKSLVFDSLPETAPLYSEVRLGGVYGLCGENRFACKFVITKPDGTSFNATKTFYVDQLGSYNVNITCEIGDTILTEDVTILGQGYSNVGLFDALNASFVTENVTLPNNIVNAESHEGITFKVNSSSTNITYKNIVDLNSLNGTVIQLLANVGADNPVLKDLKITLTDVYDSTNQISVILTANPTINNPTYWNDHGSMNAFYQVEFNNVIVADNSGYVPLKDYLVAFDQCFFPKAGNYVPFNFGYDCATKEVYTYGRNTNYGVKTARQVIWDLDNPNDAYADFKGFTTGEVYVSICGVSTPGEVTILKIGSSSFEGASSENFEHNTGNLLVKGYDFDNMVNGAVGYYYPLPDVSNSNTLDIEKHMYFDNAGTYEEVENVDYDNFYPTKAGQYRVTYESKNYFDNPISYEGLFEVNDNPVNIIGDETLLFSQKIFETKHVPSFEFSGGNGSLTKTIELVVGDTSKVVEEGSNYVIEEKVDSCKFRVTVIDKINQSKVFEYPINVDYDVIKFDLIDSFENVSIVKGNEFTVPDFTAIDYSKDDISSTNIDIIIKRGKTQALQPGEKIVITSDTKLSYCYGNEVLKTLSVKCVPEEISTTDETNSISKQFSNNVDVKSVSSCGRGVKFVTGDSGISKIVAPYPVSTSDLSLSFTLFNDMFSFDTVKFTLLSLDGNSLIFEFTELDSKVVLYINGEKTSYNIETSVGAYGDSDDASLTGASYITYSVLFDGGKRGLYNTSYVKYGDISSWSNGNPFNGFKKGCAQLSIELINSHDNDVFTLSSLSNQNLYSRSLSFGDLTSPALGFTTSLYSGVYEYGTSLAIPQAYAYDVFDSNINVLMSIKSPSGQDLIKNALASQYRLYFTEYGTYTITYSYSDSRGNSGTTRYMFVIQDSEAPTIELNGSYQETYSGEVTILGAKVKDNIDQNPQLVIYLMYNSTMARYLVNAGEKMNLPAGNYTVVYYAFDSTGNSSVAKFSFNVK